MFDRVETGDWYGVRWCPVVLPAFRWSRFCVVPVPTERMATVREGKAMATGDALLIVDVQRDFCPGGALAVPEGDRVVPVLNRYVECFVGAGLPVFASRDWHPEETRHFRDWGGPWPAHCVAGTEGAELHPELSLPESATLVSKGTDPTDDGYSAFEAETAAGDPLLPSLRTRGVERLFVGGLATDYCVRATVLDAARNGLRPVLLLDAIRGIDVEPGDQARALDEMLRAGATTATHTTLDETLDETLDPRNRGRSE